MNQEGSVSIEVSDLGKALLAKTGCCSDVQIQPSARSFFRCAGGGVDDEIMNGRGPILNPEEQRSLSRAGEVLLSFGDTESTSNELRNPSHYPLLFSFSFLFFYLKKKIF